MVGQKWSKDSLTVFFSSSPLSSSPPAYSHYSRCSEIVLQELGIETVITKKYVLNGYGMDIMNDMVNTAVECHRAVLYGKRGVQFFWLNP